MNPIKDQFLLDPSIIFLNHGSFGACPRPVFEKYQAWQRELERQPVEFLGRRATELMAESRARLAAYLKAEPDEIVYFTNPTTAINMIARNLVRCRENRLDSFRVLPLRENDEVLATDHEYGAMDRVWRYLCQQIGAKYVRKPVPLPVADPANLADAFWEGVNPRTKVVFLSHITSSTALKFPVEEICRRARQAGIISIIDGAHAPGQIDLHLKEIGADVYAGACHKWLCAPKGTGFLYVSKQIQDWLDPLVVSWGYESEQPSDSRYVDYHEWQGTRDIAAFLTVPAAIDFQTNNDWPNVRQNCHELACHARRQLNQLSRRPPICPEDWFHQMFTACLPPGSDLDTLKRRLLQEYRIEVPTISWNGQKMIRVSIQGYNDQDNIDALLDALGKLLQ